MRQPVKMVDIQVPESFCPHCFCVHDTVTNSSGGSAPEPGDHTLCIRCAGVMRFDGDMQLVAARWDDIPVAYRSKFAAIKMAIEECRSAWNRRPGATPWCSGE
jgi:hypothetical protein